MPRGLIKGRLPGRPSTVKADPRPLPDWEFKGQIKLGYTAQSLYVADYKGTQIFKQVVRLKNARCFVLFYHEYSRKLTDNLDEFLDSLEGK